MDEALFTFLCILMVLGPILFFVSIVILIAGKDAKTKKTGLTLLICSVISFIIGIGGGLAMCSVGGMH